MLSLPPTRNITSGESEKVNNASDTYDSSVSAGSGPARVCALWLAASGLLAACRQPPAEPSGVRLFRRAGLEMARVRIGKETREAIAARPEAFVSAFDVGPGAVLHLAIGLQCAGEKRCFGAWRFTVEAGGRGPRRRLFERTLEAAEATQWEPVRIPLDALAGSAVEVAFGVSEVKPGPARPIWGEARLLRRAPSPPKNVLLISVDTLRADRLGCYGYARPTSPRIDGLAAEGVRFHQAISQSPWTTPSHMSLLTSRYPSSHHVTQGWSRFARFRKGGYRVLPENATTLAEVLQEHGFRTLALTGGATMAAALGFAQGFDAYREDSYGLLDTVRPMLDRWLEESRDLPFFIFLHTFEVHAPYTHTELTEGMLTEAQRDALHRGMGRPGLWETNGFGSLLRELGLFQMKVTSALYDGDIRFTDAFLGLLLEDLRRLGLEDRTLVVLTSDHGEEFGDHDRTRFYDAHCQTVYEELIRVPLIVRLPGTIPAGDVVDTPVELVDVAPTILDVLGVPTPPAMEGKSLLGLATGRTHEHKEWTLSEATCHDLEIKALRSPHLKYIAAWEARDDEHAGIPGPLVKERVFDLVGDPGEKQNLRDRRLLRESRAILEHRVTALARNTKPGTEAPISADVLEQLRGLGYVQ
jgi:arylsulfatase A-like enzyme